MLKAGTVPWNGERDLQKKSPEGKIPKRLQGKEGEREKSGRKKELAKRWPLRREERSKGRLRRGFAVVLDKKESRRNRGERGGSKGGLSGDTSEWDGADHRHDLVRGERRLNDEEI